MKLKELNEKEIREIDKLKYFTWGLLTGLGLMMLGISGALFINFILMKGS